MSTAGQIPTNGRVFWFSTAASIPAGWSRDTNYDDKFFQVTSSDDAGDIGGGSHTPTVTDHFDTWTATHFHKFNGSAASISVLAGGFNVQLAAITTHSHGAANTPYAGISQDVEHPSVITLDGEYSIPPSIEAIFIKPDTDGLEVPVDAVILTDKNTLGNFKVCDGTSGTIDLTDNFIKGATAGSDGGTSVGALTHSHSDSTGHSPIMYSHTHSNTNSANSSSGTNVKIGTGSGGAAHPHTHTVSFGYTTVVPDTQYVSSNDGDSLPYYKTLTAIQNKGSFSETPDNAIIIYEGSVASIPSGWELYDSGDYQVKCTTSFSYAASGTNADDHTMPDHQHYQEHLHTTSFAALFAGLLLGTAGTSISKNTHTHPILNTTLNNDLSDVISVSNATASDKRYYYRKVLLIKRQGATVYILGGLIRGANVL